QPYPALEHVPWNGWSPCDLVFPSFAFILGVAIPYSVSGRKEKKKWQGLSFFDWMTPILTIVMCLAKILVQTELFKHAPKPPISGWDLVLPAVLVLSILLPRLERRGRRGATGGGGGLALQVIHHGFLIAATGFIWGFDPTNPGGFRIPGVLFRLGLIYLFTGLIVMKTERKVQIGLVAALLAAYWIIMKYVPVPGCGAGVLTVECNMAGYIDNLLLKGHLYRPNWDPEGLLHTMPAIATGLLGALAGAHLKSEKSIPEKLAGLFTVGNLMIFAGLCLNSFFPINKNLWSPSYVIFVAGIDMVILSMCVWFVDFKGMKKAAMPFVGVGTNSIFIYLMSGTIIHYAGMIPGLFSNGGGGAGGGGGASSGGTIFYKAALSIFSPCNASLAVSLAYVAIWVGIGALLYRKRIFFKI
ncbi:MAG TPA: hypothetical protein PLQ76_06770, partial [bacterium]|nr:hypothetical protein [bacterium]